jgi:PAS domain S-box-containing protein
MSDRRQFSKTMRIDLIPDVPNEPVRAKKRVVIARSGHHATERHPVPAEAGTDTRYQELLQSVYDAAIITDLSGAVVDSNVRATEFLYYTREQLCEMTIGQIISGADGALIGQICQNLENERFTLIQAYCMRQDETFFPSEIAVNKLQLGTAHLCFFLRDITERKQAEEMLLTEHNAIQNADSGIAVADLDARLEYVNPTVARLWKHASPEALIGTSIVDLVADPAEAEKMIEAIRQSDGAWTGYVTGRCTDGAEVDLQVAAAWNRNSDGERVGTVFSFMDISDRRRAEAAEREAERRRVMLESLGAACHHLGQPATILLANLSVIRAGLETADSELKGVVQSSLEAGERLGKILHKLNAVNEYRTMQYLDGPEGSEAAKSRILDI